MNSGQRSVAIGDMLAYVDDCLPAADRSAFEDDLRAHPAQRSRIEEWLFQNESIRAAFPDPRGAPAAPPGRGVAPRNLVAERAPQGAALKRADQGFDCSREPSARRSAPARTAAPPRSGLARVRRIIWTLGAAVAVWIGAPAIVSGDGARPFSNVARAAYRTFAEGRMRPVEAATSDPDRLANWFAAQIGGATPVPDLSESGFSLLGGRIVPGAFSPAGVLLYENPRHERIAVAFETADAPPETAVAFDEGGGVLCASWSGAGHSYAIVGRASRARLSALASLIRDRGQRN